MERTTTLLTARALALEEAARRAVPDLDLRAGSVTFIVGPDGPGRERLLTTLAGLAAPAAGSLTLLGRERPWALQGEAWRKLRREAAFVLHEAPLLSVMNGLRNLMLPALYHRLGGPGELEAKARRLIREARLECDLAALPAFLPEGARRALALCRSLMLDPAILFLDEPARGLESAGRRALHDHLGRVTRRGVAVVASLANAHLLKDLADQVVWVAPEGIWCFPGWQAMVESAGEQLRVQLAE